MADVFQADKRREIMQHVKTRNTAPEVKLRSLLHRRGFRFRVNRHDLPGKPDIVLPKYKTVIFVHGCFWHGHDCNRGKRPQTSVDFWNKKIDANITRDRNEANQLAELGWHVCVVWECEIKKKNEDNLIAKIESVLLNAE